MKRICTALLAVLVLICTALPLYSNDSRENPYSIGAMVRLGPYSFLALDVSLQYDLSKSLSLFAFAGSAADLNIQIFGGGSGNSDGFDAVETGAGFRYYLYDQFFHPYAGARIVAAVPLHVERDFLLYAAASLGLEIQLGRVFLGAEGGTPLKFMGTPKNEADIWGIPIYVGASARIAF